MRKKKRGRYQNCGNSGFHLALDIGLCGGQLHQAVDFAGGHRAAPGTAREIRKILPHARGGMLAGRVSADEDQMVARRDCRHHQSGGPARFHVLGEWRRGGAF